MKWGILATGNIANAAFCGCLRYKGCYFSGRFPTGKKTGQGSFPVL